MEVDYDVILLPDHHTDNSLDKRYEEFIRGTEPDAVVFEGFLDSKEKIERLWNYRSFEQIYDELGVSRNEIDSELVQQPTYELDQDDIDRLLEPIDNDLIENEELTKAVDYIENRSSSNNHNFARRLVQIFGERSENGDPMYLVQGDDRRKVAEYAANWDWFTHDDVDRIEENITNGEPDFNHIIEDVREEYAGLLMSEEITEMRDEEMANSVRETLEKPDVDYAVGVFGLAHIEGVSQRLQAEGHDINIVDMRGEDVSEIEDCSPDNWDFDKPEFSIEEVRKANSS